MIDNLSPAQRMVLQIALTEGKITIGGLDETPNIHYRVINNLHRKGYLDYNEPYSTNIESEWTPTPKAILYQKEYLKNDEEPGKIGLGIYKRDRRYQIKVPLKGYKLYEVSARTADEAKNKVNDLDSEISLTEFIQRNGKAAEAVLIELDESVSLNL